MTPIQGYVSSGLFAAVSSLAARVPGGGNIYVGSLSFVVKGRFYVALLGLLLKSIHHRGAGREKKSKFGCLSRSYRSAVFSVARKSPAFSCCVHSQSLCG